MPVKGQSLAARRRLESKAQSLKSKECWGYLLECKHSLDDLKGCPMCKLAASATKEYYRIEQLKKLEKIAAGNLEKAQMRSTLLEMWSRSQLSSYGTMKTGTPSAEISFCAATLNALSWYCNNKEEGDSISWYFRDVRNDLELRKRMYEIGHYAALSIQCFVRSYLCRQRVKAFMMKRFEYTFPTRVRPGYYTDKKTKDFWPEAPMLIRDAGPTSPRTLLRRQNAILKKNLDKAQKMKELLATELAHPGKVWRDKSETITSIRQLAILRDVIACAMKTLTKRQSRSTDLDLPVWLSLSHPAPAARQFGLNLVLENEEPLEEMVQASVALPAALPEKGGNVDVVDSASSAAPINNLTVNDRLQLLDELAWFSLKCETPEDIIDKLTCEEVQPALSSGHQIAEDLHQVWIGDINFTDVASLIPKGHIQVKPPSVSKPTALKSSSVVLEDDFDNLDDNALLAAEGYEDFPMTQRLSRDEMPSSLNMASSMYSSMDSSVSPLQSPRIPEEHSKWVNPVFPSLVYVPALQHESNNKLVGKVAIELDGTEGIQIDNTTLRNHETEESDTTRSIKELQEAADIAFRNYNNELVVPVQLQLRSFYNNRHSSGIFRLFFYDGMLVSVTQGSSWTFYKEINNSKDSIVTSILEYVESEQCQKIIDRLSGQDDGGKSSGYVSGNASVGSLHSQGPTNQAVSGGLASILTGLDTSSARGNLLPPLSNTNNSISDSQSKEIGRCECVQLYVPSDQALFGPEDIRMAPETVGSFPLTADECQEQQKTNKYLKHLSSWRLALKAAIKRVGTKHKKAVDEDDGINNVLEEAQVQGRRAPVDEVDVAKTADNLILADLGRKFGIAVPYASDLVSADYFRLLNMDVPISARPHMASREAFLTEYFCTNGFSVDLGKATNCMRDLIWQNEKYPLLYYEQHPTDLHTLVPPIFLKSVSKHLHAPKFKVEPNGSWYLSELLRIACSVDLRMSTRLRNMRPREPLGLAFASFPNDNDKDDNSAKISVNINNIYTTAVERAAKTLKVEPLAEVAPEMNILVLDIFINIPKTKLKDNSRLLDYIDEDELNDRFPQEVNLTENVTAFSGIKSMFGGSKGNKANKANVPELTKFDVSLHQIVGVFPSTLPRPPPSVDMGLASWDIILNKGETDETAEAAAKFAKKSVYGRSSSGVKKVANNWTTSRVLPGVAMLNRRLPDGNNCHFRILNTPLPQEYVEEHVPKKIRKWLGMLY